MSTESSMGEPSSGHQEIDVEETRCCVVGGGPAGAVLALLLARQGVPVALLEEHETFDREFRGDTLHPSVMELMDQIGLADRLLQLRHTKARTINLQTADGIQAAVDFSRLKSRFPYITLMPQVEFLKFITAEAGHFPGFRLVVGASVQELILEDGIVRGVRYRAHDGWHAVRALVTIGADGRFSRVRRLAGFEPVKTSAPMDVLWFRLPRRDDDPEESGGRIDRGRIFVMLNRFDYWQLGYVIPKGKYQELHTAGVEALRKIVAEVVPLLADRTDQLDDWKQVSLLSVESSRVPRWYRPGLLMIGDAAHVMTPVGGVGINYAIQDAVEAANVLTAPLLRGRVQLRELAAVQRRRELPTRVIQSIQSLLQNRVLAPRLGSDAPIRLPPFLKWPIVRDLTARLIGFGVWPVRIQNP